MDPWNWQSFFKKAVWKWARMPSEETIASDDFSNLTSFQSLSIGNISRADHLCQLPFRWRFLMLLWVQFSHSWVELVGKINHFSSSPYWFLTCSKLSEIGHLNIVIHGKGGIEDLTSTFLHLSNLKVLNIFRGTNLRVLQGNWGQVYPSLEECGMWPVTILASLRPIEDLLNLKKAFVL